MLLLAVDGPLVVVGQTRVTGHSDQPATGVLLQRA